MAEAAVRTGARTTVPRQFYFTMALTCLAIAIPLGAVATVVASWALLRRNALRLARR